MDRWKGRGCLMFKGLDYRHRGAIVPASSGLRVMRCCRCGAVTEWDLELGAKALCVMCWDLEVERMSEKELECRRYYEKNGRKPRLESARLYRERNREKVLGSQRLWRERNRERLRAYGRVYQREYEKMCREKNIEAWRASGRERMRRYRQRLRNLSRPLPLANPPGPGDSGLDNELIEDNGVLRVLKEERHPLN